MAIVKMLPHGTPALALSAAGFDPHYSHLKRIRHSRQTRGATRGVESELIDARRRRYDVSRGAKI